MTVLSIDKPDLQIDEVVAVARERIPVEVSVQAVDRIERSRALVERWVAEERVIYGITTGFGALSHTRISGDQTRELQRNILLSHAAGVGDPLPEEVVRAVMAVAAKPDRAEAALSINVEEKLYRLDGFGDKRSEQ